MSSNNIPIQGGSAHFINLTKGSQILVNDFLALQTCKVCLMATCYLPKQFQFINLALKYLHDQIFLIFLIPHLVHPFFTFTEHFSSFSCASCTTLSSCLVMMSLLPAMVGTYRPSTFSYKAQLCCHFLLPIFPLSPLNEFPKYFIRTSHVICTTAQLKSINYLIPFAAYKLLNIGNHLCFTHSHIHQCPLRSHNCLQCKRIETAWALKSDSLDFKSLLYHLLAI